VRTFLENYKNQLLENESPRSDYNGNVAQGQLLDICDELTENGHIAADVRALLNTALRDVLKNLDKGSFARARYEGAIKSLDKQFVNRQQLILTKLNSIDSQDAMDSFLATFPGSWHFSSTFIERVVLHVLGSPYATHANVQRTAGLLSWSTVPRVLRNIDDPALQASVIIENAFYFNLDSLLSSCKDPKATLKQLIKQDDFDNRCTASEVMSSQYFDVDMIGMLPLSALAAADLSDPRFASVVETSLLNVFEHEDAAKNLETLADEYDGSFTELLEISQAL
jgi:hypothetical protein